jgi:RNA polymerase sigma-70 factor, ECF subfamily
VQSCLVRALAKEHLWQPGTDLRAWLFTILYNQHINTSVVRSAKAPPSGSRMLAWPPRRPPAPGWNLRDLERAITKLPAEQRELVLLVGHEGIRYEEIATTLGIPSGTVRSRLSRARAKLRELMDERDGSAAGGQMAASGGLAPSSLTVLCWPGAGRDRTVCAGFFPREQISLPNLPGARPHLRSSISVTLEPATASVSAPSPKAVRRVHSVSSVIRL